MQRVPNTNAKVPLVSFASISVTYQFVSNPDLWYFHPRAAWPRAVLGQPQPATSTKGSGLYRAVHFPEQTSQHW